MFFKSVIDQDRSAVVIVETQDGMVLECKSLLNFNSLNEKK